MDDGETVDDDMSSMTRPDEPWIGEHILMKVAEIERSNCLQTLILNCHDISASQGTIEELIQKHATTLKALHVRAIMPDPATVPFSISDMMERCKSLLRIIAGYHSVTQLFLNIDND